MFFSLFLFQVSHKIRRDYYNEVSPRALSTTVSYLANDNLSQTPAGNRFGLAEDPLCVVQRVGTGSGRVPLTLRVRARSSKLRGQGSGPVVVLFYHPVLRGARARDYQTAGVRDCCTRQMLLRRVPTFFPARARLLTPPRARALTLFSPSLFATCPYASFPFTGPRPVRPFSWPNHRESDEEINSSCLRCVCLSASRQVILSKRAFHLRASNIWSLFYFKVVSIFLLKHQNFFFCWILFVSLFKLYIQCINYITV